MTDTLTPPAAGHRHAVSAHRRARLIGVLLVVAAVLVGLAYDVFTDDARRNYLGPDGWPTHGQAALVIDGHLAETRAAAPAPIASLAKVMTAYLILRAHPLVEGADGFTLTISDDDVAQTATERGEQQSVVAVAAGEVLTERQALMALLLPSANNVAEFLARRIAGGVGPFVDQMNATASGLGMTDTHYADPSGFDVTTVSTAADQLLLARAVARNTTFAQIVATPAYRLPVAGLVHNTDALLGHDGFIGTKTGSDDAAGGCFMFRARRRVDGRTVDVLGVVLGQPGHDLIRAGLVASRQFVRAATPG